MKPAPPEVWFLLYLPGRLRGPSAPRRARRQASRVDPAELATQWVDPPERDHAGPHQGTGEESNGTGPRRGSLPWRRVRRQIRLMSAGAENAAPMSLHHEC